MSRIAYVDGRYVPHRHASVHIEDRGFQFADGIYEVFAVIGGRRFRQNAQPAEGVYLFVFSPDVFGYGIAADPVKPVASGDEVAIDPLVLPVVTEG